jgi:hypothetical protein
MLLQGDSKIGYSVVKMVETADLYSAILAFIGLSQNSRARVNNVLPAAGALRIEYDLTTQPE